MFWGNKNIYKKKVLKTISKKIGSYQHNKSYMDIEKKISTIYQGMCMNVIQPKCSVIIMMFKQEVQEQQ